MTGHRDVERILDAWFEDEARPMPPLLLEAVLEAVPRVSRRSARSWFGWPPRVQRAAVLAVAGALVVAAVVAGPQLLRSILPNSEGLVGATPSATTPSPRAQASPGMVWNPTTNWLRSPNQRNPSPDHYGNANVWSYGYAPRAAASSIILFPFYASDAEQWYAPGLTNLFVADIPGVGVTIHPYAESASVVRDAILRWRSPVAATLSMAGRVELVQGQCVPDAFGIIFTVLQDRQELSRIVLPAGGAEGFSLTATVQPGDSLFFEVDAGTDARCDATQLTLTITTR